MKAAVLKQLHAPLELEEIPEPNPGPGELKIKLLAAGLNRRDYYITEGQYANIALPAILGSDGCGLVDGRQVVIQPGFNWGDSESCQGRQYHILGMPSQGTLAEWLVVQADHVYNKPGHLSVAEAAALPLAGLTAYRAVITKAMVKRDETVLITGIGGGVALVAAQMCLALGAKVFITSGNSNKIDRAVDMGCEAGLSYRQEGWGSALFRISGGINKVIDGTGGDAMNQVLDAVKPGACIVLYGGSAGKMNISPQKLFWKQLHLKGTTMGSPEEFRLMLEFVSLHKIKPVLDQVYPLSEVNTAIHRMKTQDQFGKLVIQIRPGL